MVSIRIAGNTENPTLLAIQAKGYEITLSYDLNSKVDTWEADKPGQSFSATSPWELLGLIAMWEVRGDNWEKDSTESDLIEQLSRAALTYDDDGNVVNIVIVEECGLKLESIEEA